ISDPNEDTYTALELKSTTSDLYDTLTIIITDDHMTDLSLSSTQINHRRPPEDSCTTRDPQHENPSVSV
ncbi:hypothetical protein M9458_000690, partial [Cirrhinus mrigala]